MLLVSVAPLASCATQQTSAQQAQSSASPPMSMLQTVTSGIGKLFSGGAGIYGLNAGPVPEPDPNRKINEQDCTKPMVMDGGNLVCR